MVILLAKMEKKNETRENEMESDEKEEAQTLNQKQVSYIKYQVKNYKN